jgi:hypothetical protein
LTFELVLLILLVRYDKLGRLCLHFPATLSTNRHLRVHLALHLEYGDLSLLTHELEPEAVHLEAQLLDLLGLLDYQVLALIALVSYADVYYCCVFLFAMLVFYCLDI